MGDIKEWQDSALFVAYFQSVLLILAAVFLSFSVARVTLTADNYLSGDDKNGIPAEIVALSWLNPVIFFVIAVNGWAVSSLFKSLNDKLHPIIALQNAGLWKNANCFTFIINITQIFIFLNPTVYADTETVFLGLSTLVVVNSIHFSFIFVVRKFIGELEAMVTTSVGYPNGKIMGSMISLLSSTST